MARLPASAASAVWRETRAKGMKYQHHRSPKGLAASTYHPARLVTACKLRASNGARVRNLSCAWASFRNVCLNQHCRQCQFRGFPARRPFFA